MQTKITEKDVADGKLGYAEFCSYIYAGVNGSK